MILYKKENSTLKNIKVILEIKVYYKKKIEEKYIIIVTNLDLPKNIEYKFILYLFNKISNKWSKI